MSANLNSQSNNIVFSLPKDFVPNEIEAKYKNFLKNTSQMYNTILDYLNSTITGINIPSGNMDVVEQTKYYGKKNRYRGSKAPYDLFDTTFIMKMKSVNNHANIIIFNEILMYYYISTDHIHIDQFTISILDENRNVLWTYMIDDIIFTQLAGFEFDFSKTDAEFKVVDIPFQYNKFYIDFDNGNTPVVPDKTKL